MSAGETPPRDQVIALARRHVWPPYTSPERHEQVEPLVIAEAEGAWLVDLDGRRYLDGNASWWTATLGHRHPRLVRALADQAARLDHVAAGGTTHPQVARLAAELCAVAPAGLTRVHFTDDGSTAVEVALKIAFQYWQQNGRPARRRFLALSSAYHGDTLGAASLTGGGEFFAVFGPMLFDVIVAPPTDAHGDDDAAWAAFGDRLEALIAARADELAGVVVEPLVQGAAGMRMYPPALLARLREATRRADTLLIADEVFTGYGRTGAMWACDLAGVTPDLLCTAKGFTAGLLPMAATLATERLYDGFRAAPGGAAGAGPSRALMHGHSFCGHPLGAAVAREVLAIYRDEDVVAGVAPRAAKIAAAMAALARLPGVRHTRALGIVGAADLGDGGYHGGAGARVYAEALARGLYARPLGDTVYVCPPLNVPLADLDQLLAAFGEAVAAVAA
jgi:adenosylmethionine-8-amino-7-oxononanoate aminotransferase